MLTKSDLSQIRKIIREETEAESENLKSDLEAEIKLARMELQKDLHDATTRLKNLEIGQRKIQKDIKIIVNTFDKEYLQLKKEVGRIETHLNLPPIT